jgi:aspartate-semialdehyde dehydrogenase
MADGMYRIGVVGASSLLGKELADELQESLLATSDFVLLDDEDDAAGQVAAAGDEAAIVQPVEADSFDRLDFVFFAGDGASTREHWAAAKRAGASLVDLSFALEGEPGVVVRAPLATLSDFGTQRPGAPDLTTAAVVSAHPAAVMLALLAARLGKAGQVAHLAATVAEPASEHGRRAMDELHQQTVNLLSFKDLPRDQYDAQAAFNLLPALGEDAKIDLGEIEKRIARHYRIAAPALPPLDLLLIQAPAFHGYVASVLVEYVGETTLAAVEAALSGENVDLVTEDSDPPSNLSAAGQEDIMVQIKPASGPGRFWLWVAADNLKLASLNAIACANELKRLRPRGKVQ